MFTKTVFAALTAALTLTLAPAAFADTASTPAPQFETFELAQTQGMDRRQDRRGDRQDDRIDRRFDRQECRSDNGLAGHDKRDCKQSERQQRNMNG